MIYKRNNMLWCESLEFIATTMCNLRCKHCSACSPYTDGAHFPDPNKLRIDLENLNRIFHASQIKILGGEPLLNPHLTDLIRVAKNSGVFDKINVTTNGLLLKKTTEEFWELVDVVEISQYPLKNVSLDLNYIKNLAAKSNTIIKITDGSVFLETFIDYKCLDNATTYNRFINCAEYKNGGSCHTLYESVFYKCSRVHGLGQYLDSKGIPHEPQIKDGIKIDSRPTLLDDLYNYSYNNIPLNSCSYCLGTSGVFFNHQLME